MASLTAAAAFFAARLKLSGNSAALEIEDGDEERTLSTALDERLWWWWLSFLSDSSIDEYDEDLVDDDDDVDDEDEEDDEVVRFDGVDVAS